MPTGRSGSRRQRSPDGEYASALVDAEPSSWKPPTTAISLPTAAAATSVRGTGSGERGSQSAEPARATGTARRRTARSAVRMSNQCTERASARIDDEGQPLDRPDDHLRAHVAPPVAARPPRLPRDPHLALGPEVGGRDPGPPDERLDAHGRSPPLRPPEEEARLREVQHSTHDDRHEAPRRREPEDRDEPLDQEEHERSVGVTRGRRQ